MHYYSHHIGDFIKDTANLDDHHLATYMRMLWAYYTDEKPFSDDCEGIAFAMRSDEKTVRRLLSHYFVLGDDGWRHNRCDKEIAKYHEKADKARKSAKARWNDAPAMRSHTDRNANEPVFDANQEPITNNQEEAKEKKAPAKRAVDYFPDVDPEIASAYVALRKRLRAPLSDIAVKGLRREAGKAGMSIEAVLTMCCERSWRGFSAEWVSGKVNGHAAPVQLPPGGGRVEL